MKTNLLATLAVVAFSMTATSAHAQLFLKKDYQGRQPQEVYVAQGAVPEKDGKVCFEKDIEVFARTKAQILQSLQSWASYRYMANTEQGKWSDANYFKNLAYAQVYEYDAEAGIITCQGSEEMVFTNKTLSKDYCEVNYTLRLNVSDNHVHATLTDIEYTYNFTSSTETQRMPAEKWITDSEALSKNGTEMLRGAARFRVKTIDLADELFSEIANAAQNPTL